MSEAPVTPFLLFDPCYDTNRLSLTFS